ncbi:hypothetical protein HBH64_017560 [Parastagonospora nodorum]|nr:hypothetical protein HBI01_126660 [Parastagonospora nodorum]KAH4313771.1 hypothetical protein HBI02_080130 [Parastagonospora nodorum]KAH4335868.1 hypothetical protein HBI00_024870 [Parastagonospora nodorum]KAH4384326.1 hypothetical protein HBH94_051770 [Parastagonospora nodorum]KAH4473015.1 hypothetical protein HBH90_037090 [Parastagonospora nodorum]
MSAPQRDDHGPLPTAAIFDDAVYCAEALQLPADQTEDSVDRELALLAEESGIQEPCNFLYVPHDISRALSTVTLDTDTRSSISVRSQETQSTSFTSAPSRTSKDQVQNSERMPVMRSPPQHARASPMVEQPDLLLDTSPTAITPRFSSSNLSVSKSVLSDSSSSSNPNQRKKRAGLLGLFSRKGSSSCTPQSRHGSRSRRTKLDCGHAPSADMIHVYVKEALQSGGQAVPSCCGAPLPRKVLESVMAREEVDLFINKALPSPGVETIRDSGYSEGGMSTVEFTRALEATSPPATPTSPPAVASRRRHEAINIDSALAKEAFRSFQTQEKEQLQHIFSFESNQRKALSAHHASSLKRLADLHETSKSKRIQQQLLELENLEEAQIMAEHDLRQAHDMETQNVATAIKHIEAYCRANSQSHPERPQVTEEDFKTLDRQRMIQQNLPKKHEDAINVLRARQERAMKNKIRKQEAELSSLDEAGEREKVTEEAEHAAEMGKLEALIESRRKRQRQRWNLKFEIWRKDWENQHKTVIDFDLDHETWPLHTAMTITPNPESSALAPYVQAAA